VVQTFYGIGSYYVQSVLTQQIGSDSLNAQTALNEIRQQTAEQALNQEIYGECMNLPPAEQQQCMSDPAREQAANDAGVDAASAGNTGNPITNGLRSALITLIMMFLYAIQWAFVNCMEAALLMTALLFPPALGISILPVAGKTIFAWASAMIGLFTTMLSYNIIVGLTAIVIKKAQVAEGQDMGGTSFRDIAFAAFIALASPILAVYLGQMGGVISRHQQASRIDGFGCWKLCNGGGCCIFTLFTVDSEQ
jgi:ABC-type multidrug transport system fused ATPase/permease subunit